MYKVWELSLGRLLEKWLSWQDKTFHGDNTLGIVIRALSVLTHDPPTLDSPLNRFKESVLNEA